MIVPISPSLQLKLLLRVWLVYEDKFVWIIPLHGVVTRLYPLACLCALCFMYLDISTIVCGTTK